MVTASVKLISAALDQLEDGSIVIRGVIDPKSYVHLGIPGYQREVRPAASLMKLVNALCEGARFPDVELAMRGEDFTERDGVFNLRSPVFIIDGLQRISAAKAALEQGLCSQPRIGCLIHISTNEKWERERFKILNTERSKVSPNVILRNMRDEHDVVKMLYNLCNGNDKSFALHGRVSWGQRMQRGEIITAKTLLVVAGALHAHLGHTRTTATDGLVNGLGAVMNRIGRTKLRNNIIGFFEFVDGAYGLRSVAYSESAAQTRLAFLQTMAGLLSRHHNFWTDHVGEELFIKRPDFNKLKQFPIGDPTVKEYVKSGKQIDLLLIYLERHFNSGKRNGHLKPRQAVPKLVSSDETEDDEELLSEEE